MTKVKYQIEWKETKVHTQWKPWSEQIFRTKAACVSEFEHDKSEMECDCSNLQHRVVKITTMEEREIL